MVTDGAVHRLEARVGSLVVALLLLVVSTPSSTECVPFIVDSFELSRETETLKVYAFHVLVVSLYSTSLLKMLTLLNGDLVRQRSVTAAVARFSGTRPEGASHLSVIESNGFELFRWQSSISTNLSLLDPFTVFLV